MNRLASVVILTFCGAFSACSGTASDEEARIAARVSEYFRANGEAVEYNFGTTPGQCEVGTFNADDGLTWNVTCPSGAGQSKYNLTLSKDSHGFNCQGASLTAKSISATVEADSDSGGTATKISITADAGEGSNADKKLDCTYRIQHGSSSATISEKNCKIDDSDVEDSKLGISCN